MTLWDDLYAHHDRAQTERDPAVGPSDVDVLHGGCVRRLAYRTQGYAPTDPAPEKMRRAAVIGEAIHAYVAHARRAAGWDLVEHPVQVPGFRRPGTLDGYTAGRLDDLKPVSGRVFESILNDGKARPKDQGQVMLYGVGLSSPRWPVRELSVTYVSRETGETLTDSWPFDPSAALDVVTKMGEVIAQAGRAPDDLGRAARSPQDRPCDGCPFRTRCWGQQASAPDALAAELPNAVKWRAIALQDALAKRRAAQAVVDSLRDSLAEYDGYEFEDAEGIRRRIRWTRGREYGDGGALDQRQARDLLEYYGLPVPTLGTAPRLSMPAVTDREDRT